MDYLGYISLNGEIMKQNLSRRQAKWAGELAEYDFILHYSKGQTMGVVDSLSR
jgi:hypothetical protein